MLITCQTMRSKGAYKDQYDLFCELFPDGMSVNTASVEKAAASGIGFEWFAKTFLPGDSWGKFADYAESISDWSKYGGSAEYDRRLAVRFCELAVPTGAR